MASSSSSSSSSSPTHPPLTPSQIARYGSQMLVPSFGARGQRELQSTSFLLVGVGGLGSAVALYLAGAGVGRLGLVDDDVVELGNLHRQVIHSEASTGQPKVLSAQAAVARLNSTVDCRVWQERLTRRNAVELVRMHDVVIDASDNLPTRYLVSDACVAAGRPLVSGAAVSTDGQIAVYNHEGGPCYRCVYPKAPTDSAVRCSDAGVMGMVVGMVGCMQAMEAVKVATGMGTTLSGRICVVDSLDCRVHYMKLPPRRAGCPSCGTAGPMDEAQLGRLDTAPGADAVCGGKGATSCGGEGGGEGETKAPDDAGVPEVSCSQYNAVRTSEARSGQLGSGHILVDVRSAVQYDICALPGSVHIPLDELRGRIKDIGHQASLRGLGGSGEGTSETREGSSSCSSSSSSSNGAGGSCSTAAAGGKVSTKRQRKDAGADLGSSPHLDMPGTNEASEKMAAVAELAGSRTVIEPWALDRPSIPIYVLCRRGIDSVTATRILQGEGYTSSVNVTGGLRAWSTQVDANFPIY